MVPETRYANSGHIHIAYQVVGDGPIDLIFLPGLFSQVELPWEEPGYARFLSRLASFSRLIPIDARGTGLSDRALLLPPMEEQVDDVLAVLDICLRRKWKGTGRGSELGESGRERVDYPLASLLGISFCGVLQKVV